MQSFTQSCRRRSAGSGESFADRGLGLANAYRAQGFSVQVLPANYGEQANVPDIVLLLKQGCEHVLVHAYARAQGALAQGAVQQLAADKFDAGATRAILIGQAGFTVSAHQAALRHGHLELVEDLAIAALVDADVLLARQAPLAAAARPVSLRQATRPAWPVRAVIGMGGMAMAAILVFAASPALQGRMQALLSRPANAELALAQRDAGPWPVSAQSRSSELNLRAATGAIALRPPVDGYAFGSLPANFNQASAPRL